jgi:hypothetical protein
MLSFPRTDVLLEIEAAPFIVRDLISIQHMFLFLGGSFIGFCALTGDAVRQFPVNRNAISGGPARSTRLSLVIPTAVSPSSLGLSDDVRELGFHLSSITFKMTT